MYDTLHVQTRQNFIVVSVCCILCKNNASCLTPPLRHFSFTSTSLVAYNFIKPILVY